MSDLYLTIASIFVIFIFSLYSLVFKGKIPILVNLLQPFLFCLLYFQIFATLGSQHYRYDMPPLWYHWFEFTGAHILRATDFLDFLEEYRMDIQNIHHNSTLTGVAIIAMHWMVDIFLIAVFIRLFSKKIQKVWKEWWQKHTAAGMKIVLTLFLVFLSLYAATAIRQRWEWPDVLFLWPADNLIRVVDLGDTFQIFQLKLHHLERNEWSAALAIFFRLLSAFAVGKVILYLRMHLLRGAGFTIEELIEHLESKDGRTRKTTAAALGKIGSAAVPALTKVLAGGKIEVRLSAIEALGQIGPAATAPLVKMLANTDWRLSRAAAEALGNVGPAALAALVEALRDKDGYVRRGAAEALGQIGHAAASAAPDLLKALSDPYAYVRDAAAGALERIGVQAVPDPVKAISQGRPGMSELLARLDPAALSYLAQACKKEDGKMREKVKKSFDNTRGHDK